MNLQRIKNLCENRQGGIVKLAEDVGMTPQNLHRCVRVGKIQASDLEKIARILGVPVTEFFDEDVIPHPHLPANSADNNSTIVQTHGNNSPALGNGKQEISYTQCETITETPESYSCPENPSTNERIKNLEEKISLLENALSDKDTIIKLLSNSHK